MHKLIYAATAIAISFSAQAADIQAEQTQGMAYFQADFGATKPSANLISIGFRADRPGALIPTTDFAYQISGQEQALRLNGVTLAQNSAYTASFGREEGTWTKWLWVGGGALAVVVAAVLVSDNDDSTDNVGTVSGTGGFGSN